jgi:hypothetical protein
VRGTKDGLPVWEDHFLPEVIDPIEGTVLPDGEEGELLFTSLTKQALPIIRYRTRDLTRLLPGTARPAMRRMQKITGRSDDMCILRGVNLFPTDPSEGPGDKTWSTSSGCPHRVPAVSRRLVGAERVPPARIGNSSPRSTEGLF